MSREGPLADTPQVPGTSPAEARSLTGVYHADGSLLGELRYLVGSRLGRAHCSLCDVTHGSLREKRAWRSQRDALPLPFTAVHLDERNAAELEASEGSTPCVLLHTASGIEMLVAPAQLEACGGEPHLLASAIERALAERARREPVPRG